MLWMLQAYCARLGVCAEFSRRQTTIRSVATLLTVFTLLNHVHAAEPGAVRAYAVASLVGFEAEDHCNGLEANELTLIVLRAKLGIAERDEEALRLEYARLKPGFQKGRREMGVFGWCASIWSLYGPEGEIVPRILRVKKRN